MKISGFTIVRNAIKLNYPVLASIQSILPICDEFVINVGDSEDGTLELIQSIQSSKIKIIETTWNMKQGSTVLSEQTNIALSHCSGDWAFYLQTDEVIHEEDLGRLRNCMARYLNDLSVDVLRFRWFHFYGSYFRYRIDLGWYQKQDRIIRNNGSVRSCGDAFAFERVDGKPLRNRFTGCYLYHYGWVNNLDDMKSRCNNAAQIGYQDENKSKALEQGYGNLDRFPVYFGSHPKVMDAIIKRNSLSQEDLKDIQVKFWWNPLLWFKIRYKTSKRVKQRII